MKSSLKKNIPILLLLLIFFIFNIKTNAKANQSNSVINEQVAEYNVRSNRPYAKLTGNKELFNEPGIFENAKVITSKDEINYLAKSNLPQNYFYVYKIAKINNRFYYAKVVSLNKKYSGWIYAGKHDFKNDLKKISKESGIVYSNPLKYSSMPKVRNGYHINDVLWTTPNYSRFDSRIIPLNKEDYINDPFRIESAVINSRGWLYYYLVDEKNSNINGWIFHSSIF
ncbi:hypothetical protein DY124_05055 [Apilactobacillus micheneri]|uniref:hypothetical protein n=1 Tax=Apilactobacillus micheneri TaxID=1899430 RepID=UPI001128333B|nr:hypothetical protein [Apilactobacillus micheneri]TPR43671.1 hypothetical protein DY124_05055 [Apilactobacillus micheneri]TPR47599.1 hypothetical protein DY125_05055 [Apilactobacillus micheneri]